jgi:magnesium transporter
MPINELLAQADALLASKEDRRLKSMLLHRTPPEIAQIINRLESGKRKTFALLPPEVQAEVITRMSEQTKTLVLPRLSDHTIARFLHFTEEDDAVDILQFLPDNRRRGILSHLKPDKKSKLEKLLTFDPETAGGLMDLNFIKVDAFAKQKEVLEKVQEHLHAQKQIPLVVVADADGHVRGFIPYRSLILSHGKDVAPLVQTLPVIPHQTDQEKVVKLALREKGEVIGVVDDMGHFLGVIHLRDLLKIAQMEATEDVLKFAGVSTEEELLGPPSIAVRLRYRWLIVNLATAFLAAAVVSLFKNTIEEVAILAAFMPIVAGMGGNAGTQTLAVAVRGLALTDVTPEQRRRLLLKEIMTGFVNGIINGVLAAGIVTLITGSAQIGLILGASMIINLVVAGVAGAVIPITLKAMKIDPAVASAVFVTTATDVFGFLTFLGLATIFLI